MTKHTWAWALLATLAASTPQTARAFCGFYVSGADAKLTNNATQVVLMRDGTRTVIAMENGYQGPPQDFAMVVPVPVVLHKENAKTLPRAVFDHVDQLTAPRLVEYWEQDPCMPPIEAYPAPPSVAVQLASVEEVSRAAPPRVKIEAQFQVGEYDVVVLSATDSSALDQWLRDNKYQIPAGAEPYLRPYVEIGMKFFVAKVDVKKVRFERIGNGPEQAVLSPLRFHYDSDAFSLPVRLGLINSSGTQDIVVTIFARGQRYEVANYDNVAIPTNLDVSDSARTAFPSFYAMLFDDVVAKHPHAVVTEYAWQATSCDPCPTPPVDADDLATLGADVLPSVGGEPPAGWESDFVVTRLHARYSKDALGDDLFFRPAPAIVGGREYSLDGKGVEQGARPDSVNNFQARYVIRHPWTGPVACEHPRRGVWGGPPNGGGAPVNAASHIGFVARGGGATLASFVPDGIPGESVLSNGGGTPPLKIPPTGGCAGCTIGREEANGGAIAALLGIALTWFRRRGRRETE
jgi:hypothetical protein